MATIPPIHCPSFQSLVLATRGEVIARPSREPSALSIDTRDDLAGACFVAIAGDRFDGHDFV
ncbi:MAG: UDP-N-acetylmuramoylalanyl-D-glutamyl-2, 6-diaminopimelate--D-alanyl-D-alanine ligase, partial [Phycisphaerales bacterium]